MPDIAHISHQVETLAELYRTLYDEGQVTRPQLLAKATGASAVMEDGTEVNAVAFEGGTTQGIVMYPKDVVIAAALRVYKATAADALPGSADPLCVQMDLSRTPVET